MAYYISNIARSKGDPKVLHSGPSSLGAADRLAKALGWFSIGLGVAELVAPERFTRALGMEGKGGPRAGLWRPRTRARHRLALRPTSTSDCGAASPETGSTSPP